MEAPKALLRSPRDAPLLRREALIAGVCLFAGLLVMPLLIWMIGRSTLGDYSHGGPFALLGDYLAGLARAELAFWVVLLGPYGFVLLLRAILRAARSTAR
jgi:hypothetical protein